MLKMDCMTIKKKKSVQVRLGEDMYKLVRREAFRRHVPMTDILEEAIKYHWEENLQSLAKQ